MGFLGLGSQHVGGQLGYYGLGDWWLTAFSDDERRHMCAVYQPMGARADTLTKGNFSGSSQSVVSFLHTLAGWFSKPQDRPIAQRCLAKAGELAGPDTPVLDWHFMYHQMIKTYYPDRAQSGFLDAALAACRNQIALAPRAAAAFHGEGELFALPDDVLPSHTGYTQLAIVLEKDGSYSEAIALCQQAAAQGWNGDWDKRIERCRKKASK